MPKCKRIRKRRRSGFTLLEVLLVVGIIALLAAFVVPQFFSTQRGAEQDITRTMVSDGGQIAQALELYRMHVGEYPEELTGLTEKPDDDDKAEKWRGPYIKDVASLKDAWKNELQYKCPGEVREESYDLWSMGPDGDEGTDDDITPWPKD